MPKIQKTTLIKLSGGFHNSKPLNLRVKTINIHPATNTLLEILTESQYEKTNKHFCGIKNCQCGGIQRTTWEIL